ncbi:MAG: hypothetical protein J1E01_00985 [Acetatifactor sp.]|nr:hypothetical protein [Acetatifactor sp.]
MQIKAITVNSANTTAVQSVQRSSTAVQVNVNNNTFNPHYKVTISKEGKRLSSRHAEQLQGSAQGAAVQRMKLRQIEESEQDEKITDGYRERLKDIEKQISSLNRSFKTEADRETIEKEQKILRGMREQKQTQLEENQRRAEEARELAAMQSAKNQEDIDNNNRKLWTLLKTLEEAEKAEEEQEGGAIEDDSGSGTPEAGNSVSDTIQNSATQFAAASMRRDRNVTEGLQWLSDLGHEYVDFANTITNNILKESEKVRAALDADDFTDDMKAELVDHLQEEATLSGGSVQSYGSVAWYRNNGLHILQEARDYKIQRIADNPLAGLQETKDSMMISAADAVLGESRQSYLDETSKKLQDKVEKLIDERNSLDRTQEEKEEEEKEQKLEEIEKTENVEDTKGLTDTESKTEEEEDGPAEALEELIQMLK